MASKEKSIIPGAILILVGVFLLLRQLGVFVLSWYHAYPVIMLCLSGFFFVRAFSRKDSGAAFPATALFVLGLFFFLRNFDFFDLAYDFYHVGEYWPVFLIAIGAAFIAQFLLKPEDWGVLIPGAVLFFLGTVFFLHHLEVFYWVDFATVWPIILIIIGVTLVVSSLVRKHQ
ncbi:MAG: LiaI-LiaF-like domain-containing protein [bacterium]